MEYDSKICIPLKSRGLLSQPQFVLISGAQNLTKSMSFFPNLQSNFLTCQELSYVSFPKIHMKASGVVPSMHPLLNVENSLHTPNLRNE